MATGIAGTPPVKGGAGSAMSSDNGSGVGSAGGDAGESLLGGAGGAEDQCARGREIYADRRAELLAQPSTLSCNLGGTCMLVVEDNLCAYTCNDVVPISGSSGFVDTLNSFALELCASCEAPERNPCNVQAPVCFLGKCEGFDV